MDVETRNSLKVILVYLAEAEAKDFEESGKPENHIYQYVMQVSDWLDKQK